jgi:hypothetical protein
MGRTVRGEEDGSTLLDDSAMEPTKCCLKEGEEGERQRDNHGGGLVQGTPYACLKLPH